MTRRQSPPTNPSSSSARSGPARPRSPPGSAATATTRGTCPAACSRGCGPGARWSAKRAPRRRSPEDSRRGYRLEPRRAVRISNVRRTGRRQPVQPPVHPLVVAHRGASTSAAEHTLGAYVRAVETGADALECDVRLTRDGHLVCVHDRTVDRTSDGSGVVSEMDLTRLDALDFSSWYDTTSAEWPDAADRRLRDEPYLAGVAPDRHTAGGVLTLETLLGLVRDASREVRLLVETKHPTRYAGLVEKELV